MEKLPIRRLRNVGKGGGKSVFLLFIILWFTILPSSADLLAQQEARVSVAFENTALETVLKEVSKLSGVKIVYNTERVREAGKVSINVKNESLSRVLEQVLGSTFTYQFVDNYVVISKRADKAATTAASDNRIELKGSVTDAKGEPLIGVAVILKGTTTGTATDVKGNFTILVPKDSVLIFSYLGYKSKEVKVLNSPIKVVLEEDVEEMDEVIVVAYGTAKKSSYTGSASVIKKDMIERSQVSSISKALQGAVPGLQANASSGQPGTDAEIHIRGIGSENATSTPLYVVDGVPYDGALNSISPSDIESITVLKDAASSALYGSRGANGVIVITTKQGKNDSAPVIDLRVTYGISKRAVKDYDQVSTNEYFELCWEAERNAYLDAKNKDGSPKYTAEEAAQHASEDLVTDLGINPYGPNFPQPVGTDGKLKAGAKALWEDDWADALTRNASRTEALLSVSGGSKMSKYFISAGYLDEQGIAVKSGFKRYTGRVNLTSQLKKWATVGVNVSLAHSVQDAPTSSGLSNDNVIDFARAVPSFYPIYERDENGNYVLENGEKVYDWGDYRPGGARPKYNMAGSIFYDKSETTRDALSMRTFVELDLWKGLKFKTSLNIDFNDKGDHGYYNPEHGLKQDVKGEVTRVNSKIYGMTFNNILTYERYFNERHYFKGLIGQEYYQRKSTTLGGEKENFLMMGYDEPAMAGTLVSFTGSSDAYKLLSYLANFEYSYDNRYFFSASVRTDGSSRFHPDNRWGTFWSVGASWKIKQEKFFAKQDWLTNFTVRASYGGQGNDGISNYAYLSLYSKKSNFGNPGMIINQLENPDLKWETNLNLNIGMDLSFLKNRLNLTVEYFDRRSKDLLFSKPLTPSIGFTSTDANVGSVKNVGWEFTLGGTLIRTNDWNWYLSVNGTTYKNKITKLPEDEKVIGMKRMVKGGSLLDFFLVEWAGVDPETGAPQWWKVDENGERVKTSVYSQANNSESKINAGSALPDLTGGIDTRVSWKNLELAALFAYSVGGKIYNQEITPMLHNGYNFGHAWSKKMLNHWTPENTNTNIPRLTTTDSKWTSTSTRFLEDGTYLRMKNLMLSYTLPKAWVNKVSLANCKVFFQAENLLTIFHVQGMDPEQSFSGSTSYRYPAMKTISFGINIQL